VHAIVLRVGFLCGVKRRRGAAAHAAIALRGVTPSTTEEDKDARTGKNESECQGGKDDEHVSLTASNRANVCDVLNVAGVAVTVQRGGVHLGRTPREGVYGNE
jgi:hypothetical protein